MARIYYYQDTILAVRSGGHGDKWATCKLEIDHSWPRVRIKEMPWVKDRKKAEINLRVWAEAKHLCRVDCGTCRDCRREQDNVYCSHYDEQLETLQFPGDEPICLKLKYCGQ